MLNTQVFRFGVHISGICGWNSMSSISNNYPKTLVSEKCLLVWIGPGVQKLFSFKVVHLTRKHPVYRTVAPTPVVIVVLARSQNGREVCVNNLSHFGMLYTCVHISVSVTPHFVPPEACVR